MQLNLTLLNQQFHWTIMLKLFCLTSIVYCFNNSRFNRKAIVTVNCCNNGFNKLIVQLAVI